MIPFLLLCKNKLLNHLYNKHHSEQQTVQCTANDDNCFAKSMNFLYSQFTRHSMIYHQVNAYKCVHQKCFEGTLVFGTLIEVANHYNSAHADVKDWEKLCTSLIGDVSEPANRFVEETVPANDDVLRNDDETGDKAANSMLENEEHETMDQDNCSATVCQTSNENKKHSEKQKRGLFSEMHQSHRLALPYQQLLLHQNKTAQKVIQFFCNQPQKANHFQRPLNILLNI